MTEGGAETASNAPRRVLGPWAAASVVVGMVVGAGIFRSASLVAAGIGNDALVLVAWAVGGVFALAGALCYAELSTAFPHPGGDYRFLRLAFGPGIAFLFAWSRFAVIFTASATMLAFVAADYIAELVPLSAFARGAVAAGSILLLTVLNLAGVRRSTGGQVALVAIDVLALLALGGAALALLAAGTPQVAPTPAPRPFEAGSFGAAMVFVMLAFGGFNDSATLSAEVRRPRDMTIAMVGGMGLVTALYLLANWAYLSGLGGAGLASSAAPAAQLMAHAFGPAGQIAMVVAVTIAALAILNALVLVGGRTLYAAAGDEPALARLAQWDSASGVPRAAIFAQCAVSLVLVVWGANSTGFAKMVDYMAPVYWLFLSLTGLSLMRLRRRDPDGPRPYRVPFYPIVPLMFTAGSTYVLVSSVLYVGWVGCAISFGMLALGLVVRAGLNRNARGVAAGSA
ncbi:APC family permease [Sandarakinorhabdus rubra]|uniref:APC family permease n=1 Tax=Sandarakinorhabdus rubra TaxID=2672568 RepID=UPI0013DBD038|nr:amino acid permease [Sandarakinorhabdus rubra]